MSTPVKLGTEFLVNTYTASHQRDPSIASLPDGGFVIIWQSNGQDTSQYGIYGQRYDANGAIVGAEFKINTTTANDQTNPFVTSLTDGGFLVTWEDSAQDGSGKGIFGQRYAANGTVSGVEFKINATTASDQSEPAVTSLSTGGFLVTWQSLNQDGSGLGIYAQIYAANGTVLVPEFRVNTTTANDQRFPSVTELKDGKFVVSWDSSGQDGDGGGIYGQLYAANGTKIGSEFQINTFTTSWQVDSWVTALDIGGFVVSWDSSGQDGDGGGIYGQRYDASGVKVGSELHISTATFDSQFASSIVDLPDGGFVVVWVSDGNQDGDGYGIYGQRYDANGDQVGGEFLINTATASDQWQSSIAALADGSFVVTWRDEVQDGNANGVYAQRYKAQLFGTSDADTMSDNVGANWMDGQGGDDVLNGKGGADKMFGSGGKDTLAGGNGKDILNGGGGKDLLKGGNSADVLKGGKGNDKLSGNKGNDKLTGNAGKDKFIFKKFDGTDTITDFTDGQDKIDLKAFNFSTKAQALAKFYEIGSATNDKLGFDHKGTTIIVKGIDIGDLSGADIII